MKKRTIAASVALGTSAVLALAACSPPGSSSASETLENGDQSVVDMAVFNGWDEGIAASWLWKSVLRTRATPSTSRWPTSHRSTRA